MPLGSSHYQLASKAQLALPSDFRSPTRVPSAAGPGLDRDMLIGGEIAHYPSLHVRARSKNPIQLTVRDLG